MPWEQSDNTLVTHILGKTDLPKDGWELLKRDMGFDDAGRPVPNLDNPYVVLYNKRTAMLRVFVAVGKRESAYKFAEIKLLFNTAATRKAGTLNRLEGIGTALENTVPGFNSADFVAVSRFNNETLKWFMADFPMEYDPCVCQFDSKLLIEVNLIEEANIQLTGITRGTLLSTSTATGASTTSSDFDNGVAMFKKANGAVKAGQNTFKSFDSFQKNVRNKLNIQGTKTSTADGNLKIAALEKLKTAIAGSNFLKDGLKALPYVASAVSILDSFFGGGKEGSGTQPVSLQPMSIEMTTQMSGTIKAEHLYKTISFNNPGTRMITTPEEYPYYNEALGIFSLIKTPVVEIVDNEIEAGTSFGHKTAYRIAEELQYVINPASGLEVQDFQVAILQEGMNYPKVSLTNWIYEGLKADNSYVFRTPYIDSGCLVSRVFRLNTDNSTAGSLYVYLPDESEIYLKLMLNLRHVSRNPNLQNVLLVLKYPVSLREVTTIVPDFSRPCLAVQPPMPAPAVQAFCTGAVYTSATRLRNQPPTVPAGTPPPAAIARVHVYPNPATNDATLSFASIAGGPVSAYITDMTGRRLQTVLAQESLAPGEHQKHFSTTHLAAGLYQCVVEMPGGHRSVVRLSVVR